MNPEHPQWEILKAQSPHRFIDIGCGPGWDELVLMTHYSLHAIDPLYRLDQIKEKFGGLRYYFAASEDVSIEDRERMYAIENLVERLSFFVCEECSAPGEICQPSKYWLKTLCPSCLDAERERRRALSEGQTSDGSNGLSTATSDRA